MGYSFERFGTITLPVYNREMNMAPVSAVQRIVATAAGAFDLDGSGRAAQQFPHPLTVEAIVFEETAAALRAALDALRAAVGTRAYLYRRADDDSTVHRALCRLTAMEVQRTYEQRRAYQPVTLQFLQLSAWQGASTAWTLDDGEFFDDGLSFDATSYAWSIGSSPTTRSVTNGGNLPVTDVVFTITAGATALTNPILTGGGMDLRWTGTIAATKSLVIDCGALSVLNDGANAYSGLTLGATHAIETWCSLAPGSMDITLTVTGALTGATWGVSFRERWA